MKRIAILALALGLAACSSNPTAAPMVQITTCDGFNAALTEINAADDAGLILQAWRADISSAVAAAKPICSRGAILTTDSTTAGETLAASVATLTGILAKANGAK